LHGAIEAEVTTRPDATIAELRAWLFETHKVSASTGLMWKTLAALDLTLKTYGPPRRQVVFVILSDQSTPTYPVSGHRPGQDGDSHVSSPHKTHGVERHFLKQVSGTPINCQAISFPPLADIVSHSPRSGRTDNLFCATTSLQHFQSP